MEYQITCVNKNQYGAIISVGCLDGSQFTEQEVITKISSGDCFYTYDSILKKIAVVKINHRLLSGRKFIKSAADCTTDNNLDNLPPCQINPK
jgi:Protein of unknown function (DUF3892)